MNCFTKKEDLYAANYRRKRNEPDRRPAPGSAKKTSLKPATAFRTSGNTGCYICRGSISRIEDKSRTVTDIELMGLAKVLGVKIQDLFE